jgi:hypothetical protein
MRIVVNKRKFEQRNKRSDVRKLRGEEKQEDFQLELRNRFQALSSEPEDDVESIWNKVKNTYLGTSEGVLGSKYYFKKRSDVRIYLEIN